MMILQWSIFLFLLLQVENVQSSHFSICLPFKSCEVSVDIQPQDEKPPDPQFNPLYLVGKSGSYELAIPQVSDDEDSTNLRVFFSNKKKLIYACPKNIKKHRNDKVNPELSQQQDIIMPSTSETPINEYCAQKVEPTMKTLKTLCSGSQSSEDADKFTLYEIGFKVSVRYNSTRDLIYKFIFKSKDIEERTVETWHPLYKTCHNTTTRATLYTIHTLHGGSVGIKTPTFTGTFRDLNQIDGTDEIIDTKTTPLDNIYQQNSVKPVFSKTFGRSKPSSYLKDDFFAKGHLVPDADMTFLPWKYATYLYVNAVPMWQSLNNSAWKSVEIQIRNYVNKSDQKFTIYTGVYEILSYGRNSIFLGDKKKKVLPVPLYLWKIVHNEQKNEAIAFIVINDPHTVLQEKDLLCSPKLEDGREICSTHNWPEYYDKVDEKNKRKIMHCCTVQKLREKVPYAPNLRSAKILQNTLTQN